MQLGSFDPAQPDVWVGLVGFTTHVGLKLGFSNSAQFGLGLK